MKPVTENHGRIRGARYPDGRYVGFDYAHQAWIDTDSPYPPNTSKRIGSASNPITIDPTDQPWYAALVTIFDG